MLKRHHNYGMFGSFGAPEFFLLLALAIVIALFFWVARDARGRGMNATIWVIAILFFNLLGLFAYLVARTMRQQARQQ